MAGRRKNLRYSSMSIANQAATLPSPSVGTLPSARANNYQSNPNSFYPRLIFSQIIALQSIHYLILSFLFQVNHVMFGTSITIDRIFTGKYLNIWSARSWLDCGAILTSSVIGWVRLVLEPSFICGFLRYSLILDCAVKQMLKDA